MRFKFVSVFAAAVTACALYAGSANAIDRAGAVSISPMVGVYMFEGDQHLKTSPNYAAALGYYFNDRLGAELGFNFVDSGFRRGGLKQVDVFLYRLDGIYHLTDWKGLSPYVAAGGGAINFCPRPGGSDTKAIVDYGGGLEYFFNDCMSARADVRHVIMFDHPQNSLSFTAGLKVYLGCKKARAKEAAQVTPPAVQPAPPPAPQAKAPAPPKPVTCIDLDIKFDFDKADIKPEYDSEVKKVADFLKQNPKAKADVQGFTDAVGSDEYNLGLSKRRAEAVRDYLVANFGIEASRLSSEGYGKSSPALPNLTEEGRSENRRAVRVICSEGTDKPLVVKAVCVGLKVEFEPGSAEVRPQFDSEIGRVADYMKAHPNDIGTIEGYADYKGPAEANLKLSQKRADAVKDYMVSKFGIPADRLKTKAFGEERPIADNTTPEGRAANRYAAEVFCEPEENVSEAK
ncbi:MAG TPA: OmpA family protein [Nitrospirota bacterium]